MRISLLAMGKLYIHSAPYTHNHEDDVQFDDPALTKKWPLAIIDASSHDQALPFLSDIKSIRL